MELYNINFDKVVRKISIFPNDYSFDDVSRKIPSGVFTTFRTYNGRKQVIGLNSHLERLFNPAKSKRIEPSVTKDELRIILRNLLEVFNSNETKVRISLSLSDIDYPGQVTIILDPLIIISEQVYLEGVRVVTRNLERESPRLKSTMFIENSMKEREHYIKNGIFEILMIHDGKILEGVTSNFFGLCGTKIITARKRILLGVTRGVVLRLIKKEGIEISYKALRIGELPRLEEAFITSSSRGIVPVIEIDNLLVGQGRPGKVSQTLRHSYDTYVMKNADNI